MYATVDGRNPAPPKGWLKPSIELDEPRINSRFLSSTVVYVNALQ